MTDSMMPACPYCKGTDLEVVYNAIVSQAVVSWRQDGGEWEAREYDSTDIDTLRDVRVVCRSCVKVVMREVGGVPDHYRMVVPSDVDMEDSYDFADDLCYEAGIEPVEVITSLCWVDFAAQVLQLEDAGNPIPRDTALAILRRANPSKLDDNIQEYSHWQDIFTMEAEMLLEDVKRESEKPS